MRRLKSFKNLLYVLTIAGLVVLIIFLVFLIGLTQHNCGYMIKPVENPNEVSRYLTHQLAPEFLESVQTGEPFELIIEQAGINDVLVRDSIVRGGWPVNLDYIDIYAPVVEFLPENINLYTKIGVDGLRIYIKTTLSAQMLPEGMMKVEIRAIKAGEIDITGFAMSVINELFQKRFSESPKTNPEDNIIGAILKNQPFEPIFRFGEKKFKIYKVESAPEQLIIGLEPIN